MLGMGSCYCHCDHTGPTTLWKLRLPDLETEWFVSRDLAGTSLQLNVQAIAAGGVAYEFGAVSTVDSNAGAAWDESGAWPSRLWKTTPGTGTQLGPNVVVAATANSGTVVWLSGANGRLYRLDAATGTVLSSSGIVSCNKLYGRSGSDEAIVFGGSRLRRYDSAFNVMVSRSATSCAPLTTIDSASPAAYRFAVFDGTANKVYDDTLTQTATTTTNAAPVLGGGLNHVLVQNLFGDVPIGYRLKRADNLADVWTVTPALAHKVGDPLYVAIDASGNCYAAENNFAAGGSSTRLAKYRASDGAVEWTVTLSTNPLATDINLQHLLYSEDHDIVLLTGRFGVRAYDGTTGALAASHLAGIAPSASSGYARLLQLDGDYLYAPATLGSSEYQ